MKELATTKKKEVYCVTKVAVELCLALSVKYLQNRIVIRICLTVQMSE